MLNRKLFISALLCSTFTAAYGQSDNGVNYLDYFAADNSLDNQPLIGTENHLRFFPVFSMKDSIVSAEMRVYRNYDPIPYHRSMDRMNEGIYWEGLLPPFKLGQGIHRIEVEIKVMLDTTYSKRLEHLTKEIRTAKGKGSETQENIARFHSTTVTGLQALESVLNQLKSNVEEHKRAINENIVASELDKLKRISSDLDTGINVVSREFKKLEDQFTNTDIANCQTFLNEIKGIAEEMRRLQRMEVAAIEGYGVPLGETIENHKKANNLLEKIQESIASYQQIIFSLHSELLSAANDLSYTSKQLEKLREETADGIYNSIIATLSDRSYSGPGIGKSDVVIASDLTSARILYRNYNIGIRQNPALDPAEKLGIFRVRYVPFAVIGGELVSAVGVDSVNRRAVFEVGMGFGDVTIASDQLFKPALSARRLGVAFAISEELFSDSATIRALAFTYEFNAYGSIAIGANFPVKRKAETYFSFGINKKAFEALLSQIQNVFD